MTKITIERGTLQQLHDELDTVEYLADPPKRFLALMEALRAALAAEPAEPVALDNACMTEQAEPYGHVTTHTVTGQQFFYRYPQPPYLDTAKECIAVYAAPPAQPAPVLVPLTDEQLFDCLFHLDTNAKRLPPGFKAFARAIERAHGIAASPEVPK